MRIYGNRGPEVAQVDTDMIAFNVSPEELEVISEYLVAAIVTRCLMEFGQAPEVE